MPHLFKRSKANQQKWKAFWLQWRFHCFCFSFQESFRTAVAAICTSRLNSSCPETEVLGSSSPQIVQMPSLHLYIHNWLLWGGLGLWSYRMWWFSNKSTPNYRNHDDFELNEETRRTPLLWLEDLWLFLLSCCSYFTTHISTSLYGQSAIFSKVMVESTDPHFNKMHLIFCSLLLHFSVDIWLLTQGPWFFPDSWACTQNSAVKYLC